MYSRKLTAIDEKNTVEALKAILRQLNVIQEESERKIETLEKRIRKLEGL